MRTPRRLARRRKPAEPKSPTHFRDRALRSGLWKALVTLGIVYGIGALVVARVFSRSASFEFCVLTLFGVCGGVVLVFGIKRWFDARSEDEAHFLWQRAPEIPLASLEDHDMSWVSGRLRCPRPVIPPEFGPRSAWYRLVIEEQRSGGGAAHWAKIRETSRAARAWLQVDGYEVEVQLRAATCEHVSTVRRQTGNTRYTLERIAPTAKISVCSLALRPATLKEEPDPLDEDEEHRMMRRRRRQRAKRNRSQSTDLRRRFRLPKAFRNRKHEPTEFGSLEDEPAVEPEKAKLLPLLLVSRTKFPMLVTGVPRAEWHDRSEAEESEFVVQAALLAGLGIASVVWFVGALASWWGTFSWTGVGVGLAVALATIAAFALVGRYNSLVMYRQRVDNARSHIDIALKMRHDLVPNLVELVKAAAAYEREVQTRVAELRAESCSSAELVALGEDYPKLGADENFRKLQERLAVIEDKVAHARGFLVDTVTEYNTLTEVFPSSVVAWVCGMRRLTLEER